MKKIVEKLEEIIKEKSLERNDFMPVIDLLVAGAEEDDKIRKENVASKESIEKIEKEKAELESQITTKEKELADKEKELADLKIKYVERFSDSDNKNKIEETKEDITIKDLFEEVK